MPERGRVTPLAQSVHIATRAACKHGGGTMATRKVLWDQRKAKEGGRRDAKLRPVLEHGFRSGSGHVAPALSPQPSFVNTRRARRFVLIGRDGVLRRRLPLGCESLSWDRMEFLPRALDGLRLLAEHGFSVLLLSHQESARGVPLPSGEMKRWTERFLLEVALAGGRIEKVYDCPHVPITPCDCRPPGTGLLRKALADFGLCAAYTSLISESARELTAASKVGCPWIRIQRDAFLSHPISSQETVVSNLHEAAEHLVNHERTRQTDPGPFCNKPIARERNSRAQTESKPPHGKPHPGAPQSQTPPSDSLHTNFLIFP
jgi:D-glycero-D-manno-heptose 1,7-bisphosphate phosphatase